MAGEQTHKFIAGWVYENIAWPKLRPLKGEFEEASMDLDRRRDEVPDHHRTSRDSLERIVAYAGEAIASFTRWERSFQHLADALHLVADWAIPHEDEEKYDKKAKALSEEESKEERERILREACSLCEKWRGQELGEILGNFFEDFKAYLEAHLMVWREKLARKLGEILGSPDEPLSKAMKASYFLAWRVVMEAKVVAMLREVRRRPFLPREVLRRVGEVVRNCEWFKIEAEEVVRRIKEVVEGIIKGTRGWERIEEAEAFLEQWQRDLEQRERRLKNWEAGLEQWRRILERRQRDLEQRERRLKDREAGLEQWRRDLDKRERRLKNWEASLKRKIAGYFLIGFLLGGALWAIPLYSLYQRKMASLEQREFEEKEERREWEDPFPIRPLEQRIGWGLRREARYGGEELLWGSPSLPPERKAERPKGKRGREEGGGV